MYLESTNKDSNHEARLLASGKSFHMTPHKEWFCEYGGDVFRGDDLTTKNKWNVKGFSCCLKMEGFELF